MSRSHSVVVPVHSSLVTEMASGELGDQRLNARRDRLVAVLEQHPDTGFPEACADDAEVEALYRFLRNPRVSFAQLLEPHLVATHARCAALGEVLVIHDTTDMVFTGDATRAGLARLGKGRHGFWLHAALAVSADGLRAPLGLLSLMPFIRKMQAPGTDKDDRARFADPEKESRHWGEGVTATRTRLDRDTTAIHVMDRGADSYELFAALLHQGERFVVRLNHDRRVLTDDGPGALHEARPRTEVLGARQVRLAARRTGNRPQQARRKHPSRDGRVATLRFAARPLTLQRPKGHHYRSLPAELQLNVVYAWEPTVPLGEDAVEWRLITTEPIDTLEHVLRIVDWYRARWVIEEYFKALKTGCVYEQRQLESLATLLVALALLAPIAWHLLALRHLARAAPRETARAVLSVRQLQVLRASPAGAALGRTISIRDALLAVARLGGHLKQNGDPGWRVLGRGIQHLLLMEAGWAAAEHARKM